jgi:hypothetical protein
MVAADVSKEMIAAFLVGYIVVFTIALVAGYFWFMEWMFA